MDIDLTVALQLGLFLITLTLLNRILLRPLLRLFETRYHKMYVLKEEAERLRHESVADVDVYEGRMRAARDTGQREREQHIRAAREEERRVLDEMRASIAKTLAAARQQIAQAELAAADSLQEQTHELARQLVAKIVLGEVKS